MTWLTIVTIVVMIIGLLNLVLISGVLRRLNEHETAISKLSDQSVQAASGIRPGEFPAAFSVTALGGGILTEQSLTSQTIVGFFLNGCTPCAETMPKFVKVATSARRHMIAVLVGFESAENDYAEQLSGLSEIVLENSVDDPEGTISRAFMVASYPTIFSIDEAGAVLSTDREEILSLSQIQ